MTESPLGLDKLFTNSTESMCKICMHLHARDIFALEQTNHAIRDVILDEFWPTIKRLIVYSVESPLTLLSIQQSSRGLKEIITNRKMAQILTRCGKKLIQLDLAVWRCGWRFSGCNDGGASYYWHDPVRIIDIASATVLTRGIGMNCRNLRQLDLSHIPLSGKVLVELSKHIGHSLESIRLMHCFSSGFGNSFSPNMKYSVKFEDAGEDIPFADDERVEETIPFFYVANNNYALRRPQDRRVKKVKEREKCILNNYECASMSTTEFSQFLANMPNLRELDISYTEVFNDDFSFANISTKLTTFKAIEIHLNARQMIDVLQRATKLTSLHCDTHKEKTYFLKHLQGAESLWLWCCNHSFNSQHEIVLNRSTCAALRTLRLSFGLSVDPLFNFQNETLPNLRELAVSSGHLIVQQFLAPQSNPFGRNSFASNKMPNLTSLYISFQQSEHFNDELVRHIAEQCKHLQEVRLMFCRHITWMAFNSFLNYCPSIRFFEGVEQMTDLLLDRVMSKCSMWPKKDISKSLFYFIRARSEYFCHTSDSALFYETFRNEANTQSESMNLHPNIVYRETNGCQDVVHAMHYLAWPTTNLGIEQNVQIPQI